MEGTGNYLMGTEFQICKTKRVLGMDIGCTTTHTPPTPLNCTLTAGLDGKFYVLCILPQQQKKNEEKEEKHGQRIRTDVSPKK